MEKKRKHYTKEFKMEVVKYLVSSGKTGKEVSEDFGVAENTIWKWKRGYEKTGEKAFDKNANIDPRDVKMKQLEKELAAANRRCEILKKAVAIFSTTEEKNSNL